MKNMRTIPVYTYAIDLFSICIARDMISFLHDKDTGPMVRKGPRSSCSVHAGTDYKVVISPVCTIHF